LDDWKIGTGNLNQFDDKNFPMGKSRFLDFPLTNPMLGITLSGRSHDPARTGIPGDTSYHGRWQLKWWTSGWG